MAGVDVPRGMDGVDLSRFFEGRRPPKRPYAFGGYGNSYFVRTDDWAMYGPNRGGDFHLYDRDRDPGEGRDVSGSHAGKARELYGVVRRRAGRPADVPVLAAREQRRAARSRSAGPPPPWPRRARPRPRAGASTGRACRRRRPPPAPAVVSRRIA